MFWDAKHLTTHKEMSWLLDVDTYLIGDQRRPRWVCATAQSYQSSLYALSLKVDKSVCHNSSLVPLDGCAVTLRNDFKQYMISTIILKDWPHSSQVTYLKGGERNICWLLFNLCVLSYACKYKWLSKT